MREAWSGGVMCICVCVYEPVDGRYNEPVEAEDNPRSSVLPLDKTLSL